MASLARRLHIGLITPLPQFLSDKAKSDAAKWEGAVVVYSAREVSDMIH